MYKQAVMTSFLLAVLALFPLCFLSVNVETAETTLAPPTVNPPAGWTLAENISYPQSTGEHDSGAGLLKYNSSVGYVSIYYEKDLGNSYTSVDLVNEAVRTFNAYLSTSVNKSEPVTVGAYFAGLAQGYDSTQNQEKYSIVFTANGYYINILASFDPNATSQVNSLLDSINVPINPNAQVTTAPSGSDTTGYMGILITVLGIVVVVIVVGLVVVLLIRRRKPKNTSEPPPSFEPVLLFRF
jgi:hypothetical protein